MNIQQLLSIFVMVTVPQTYVMTMFCLQLFGVTAQQQRKKLLLHTAAASVLLIVSMGLAPPVTHPIFGILLYFLSLSFFFRDISYKSRLIVALTCYMLNIVVELSSVFVTPPFGGPMIMRDGPFYFKALLWPVIGLFAVAAWMMRKNGSSPGKRVMLYLQDDSHRHMKYFALMIFLQCFSMVLLFLARYFFVVPDSVALMLFVANLIIILLVTYMAIRIIARTRDDAIKTTQDAFVGDLMQMITTIRGQRHDFANHMQVIYSMLKMNKLQQLEKYLADVAGDIQNVNKLSDQFPATAFGAFLQAKAAIALERRIRFEYELPELPKELSAVKNIDLVRIVGNLVDNAFDEVMDRPVELRAVSLQVNVEGGELLISVSNTGAQLTDEVKRRIFTPGYSTKQNGHSGLGLSIVVERVTHYGGKVDVGYEQDRGVVFTIGIPVGAGGHAS